MSNSNETEKSRLANIDRRELLGLIGTAAALTLLGAPRQALGGAATSGTPPPSCVVKPAQTEGPYFVDEKLNRSDIRTDPGDGTPKAGAELRLIFNVSRVDGGSCAPLAGVMVDIWHCDALGVYSDIGDDGVDTRGKKFLRGYQLTDRNGAASFITIYPGWYPGRTVHIHFKVRTGAAAGKIREFTSQLYFDDALSDQVFAQAPYAAKGRRDRRNERDGIFRSGGSELMLTAMKEGAAYVATFNLGLQSA